eukprot:30964-Prymnesium_polylepis.1
MSAIRAKLEAIKKEKVCAIKKVGTSSPHKCGDDLSKPTPVRKTAKAPAKDQTAEMIKKLIAVLQPTEANNTPKAKKTQEWDSDESDDEESDEEE